MPEMFASAPQLFWVVILSYLLGSIPFGMVITRLMGLGDLREIGSGNIGTTNVLRTGSKGAALATLILDGAKSVVSILVARQFVGEDAAQLAALSSIVGHIFPVWLKFRGGKGVAPFLGALLALAWPVFLAVGASWLLVAFVSRYSSLAALAASALSPLWFVLFGYTDAVVLSGALMALIFWRHKENIQRLHAGSESKIGQK